MFLLLHCALAAAQCIVIAPVCVLVCGCVCGSVTTITRNCVHRSSPNSVCMVKSDHLQLIKFWPSCAPGKGVCGGAIFFWFRLTTASAQCLLLSERFFHS